MIHTHNLTPDEDEDKERAEQKRPGRADQVGKKKDEKGR